MSPFKKYRHILFEGYSTAGALQQFALSLYDGETTQFRADRLSNFDDRHLQIFVEFAQSYHQHGENDPEFMAVCREMWDLRKRWGKEHLARVEEHLQIDPKTYDEGERAWREQRDWLEQTTQRYKANGWIAQD